jgi:hydrogenase/urease accessory protein HupE
MDAEARAFYAVGLSAVILGLLGLLVRALGAAMPWQATAIIVALLLIGVLTIALEQRGLFRRWRAWRASRPPPWPAGWKMPPRDK